MKKIRPILLIVLTGTLAACNTTHHTAPVEDRTPPPVKVVDTPKPVAPAPKTPAVPKTADARGFYTVRKGDTLLHIALDFGQNYRDIITWNNLANPNDIKVDQELRVLPPEPGAISGGVQTASVSPTSGIEVKPLNTVPPAPVPNKSAPRGDKRVYSETALAELQKPDANAAAVPAVPTVAAATAPKIVDKAVEPATDDDSFAWMWPTDGKLLSAYDDGKKGIDIAGLSGQQICAAAPGKVMYASSVRGYGNLVIIKHNNNLLSAYAHNKTILVKEGQIVNKGQKIAEMGNSDSDAVKLHFEIRQQGKPVDPTKFLPNR